MQTSLTGMTLSADAESQILEVERRWTQAHLDLDLQTIDDIMAEGYKKIAPDGSVVDKRLALAAYAAREKGWDVARSDELEVDVHGTTGLVIGRWTGRGENLGERFDYQARFVSVYIFEGSGWKLAFEQATPITDGPPG